MPANLAGVRTIEQKRDIAGSINAPKHPYLDTRLGDSVLIRTIVCAARAVRLILASSPQRRNISKTITLKASSGVCGGAAERLQSGTLFLDPKKDAGSMVFRVLCSLVVLALIASPASAADRPGDDKLDPHLRQRASAPAGTS